MADADVYNIVLSPQASIHLEALKKHKQVTVVQAIEEQLTHEPTVETRNRKLLRPNPIAPWELRVDDVRVFYDASTDPEPTVYVYAIGIKIRNRLWIGGEDVTP